MINFKELGKYLVGQGFTPEHVINTFNQSDANYEPIIDINEDLFNSIIDFCNANNIDGLECIDTLNVKDLF